MREALERLTPGANPDGEPAADSGWIGWLRAFARAVFSAPPAAAPQPAVEARPAAAAPAAAPTAVRAADGAPAAQTAPAATAADAPAAAPPADPPDPPEGFWRGLFAAVKPLLAVAGSVLIRYAWVRPDSADHGGRRPPRRPPALRFDALGG